MIFLYFHNQGKINNQLSNNRIRTVFLSPAILALEPRPNSIKLVHGGFYEGGIVGEYARLEVPGPRTLHPDTGPGQVGGAEVGDLGVEDEDFEMHAGAEHAFISRSLSSTPRWPISVQPT